MAKVGDIITLPLTPQQFSDGLEAIDAPSHPEIKSNIALTPTTGKVQTSVIDFDYSYNGTDTMALALTGVHGITGHLVSDDKIRSYVLGLIKQNLSTEHIA